MGRASEEHGADEAGRPCERGSGGADTRELLCDTGFHP